jgi:hypothetical protein
MEPFHGWAILTQTPERGPRPWASPGGVRMAGNGPGKLFWLALSLELKAKITREPNNA